MKIKTVGEQQQVPQTQGANPDALFKKMKEQTQEQTCNEKNTLTYGNVATDTGKVCNLTEQFIVLAESKEEKEKQTLADKKAPHEETEKKAMP